jgi:toxin ParE1/3/4
MAKVLITPAAEGDLIGLWVYIARDNPEAADRVYQAAYETFETLSAMPGLGTLYQSKRAKLKGLRFFPVKRFPSYVVYYRPTTEGLEIVRVLHGHIEKQRRLEPEE